MYDLDIKDIGSKLREYRKAKKITMEELGNAIGKSKGTIARYENGEIVMDFLTSLEICNALNIDLNDICNISTLTIEKNKNQNPFKNNLLYLYYISKNGMVISSIEITEKKYANYVLMKNGLKGKTYRQEYSGVLECNYNTAFICLTNAISNPGLDKFQIEIDLHSKTDNMYYGLFLGISDNTHKPTCRKCILMKKLINSKEELSQIFNRLTLTQEELNDIYETKYWDFKPSKMKDFVIKL